MKTKIPALLVAAALGSGLAIAQDEPRPPRPPGEQRDLPPLPPESGQRPPGPPEGRRPESRERDGARPPGERPPGENRRPDPRPGGGVRSPEGHNLEAHERDGARPPGERPPGENRRLDLRAGGGSRLQDGPGRQQQQQQQQAPSLKPTAYLGVVTSPVPRAMAAQIGLPEGFGLVVDDVLGESPAKAAGIERFDVLKMFGDQKLVDPNQLAALVRAEGKDKEVIVTLLRKGQQQTATVKIGEKMLPEQRMFGFRIPEGWGGNSGEMARRFEEAREKMQRQFEQFRGPAEEKTREWREKFQDRMRGFQQQLRDYQEKIERWSKDPHGEVPQPPRLEMPFQGGQPPQPPGPLPPNVLREALPGGRPSVHESADGTTTTWNTANARVSMKDDTGEMEVRSENGKRHLVAKDAKGQTIFDGAIDTEEQRRALPEEVRKKLAKVQMHSRAESARSPRPDSGEPGPDRQPPQVQ